MKKICLVVAVALGVIGPATVAQAKLNTGSLVSYKDGKLVITHKKAGKSKYRVTKKTDCGVSYGQMGDSIKCGAFSKAKYEGRPIRVNWHREDGRKVADLVSVNMAN
jgi:hypothetical protein